ncbi:hypothetical protein Tco_0323210 [Tanacetum coccineum]
MQEEDKTTLPPAGYTLTNAEKDTFCETLHNINVPQGTDISKITRKQSKNEQTRARESEECKKKPKNQSRSQKSQASVKSTCTLHLQLAYGHCICRLKYLLKVKQVENKKKEKKPQFNKQFL